MRPSLPLLVILANAACASVERRVGLDLDLPVPPVAVREPGAAADRAPTLLVAREVLDGWNFLYLHIDATEFALCLEGQREAGRVVITGFRLAHVVASSYSGVKYAPCAVPHYVGTAHNHPPGDFPDSDSCYQSPTDLRTFRNDSRAHVDIIICGRDRFVWTLKNGNGAHIWRGESAPVVKVR